MAKRAGLLSLLASIAALHGCVPSQSITNVVVRNPRRTIVPLADIRDGAVSPLLRNIAEYALLAASAYGKPDITGAGCPVPWPQASHWIPVADVTEASVLHRSDRPRISIPGIGYRLWRDTNARDRKRFALVFRGTDFSQWGDWYSNARWLTRLNPATWDQYGQTRDLMTNLIRKLDDDYGDYDLIAIGHSLGGGLAQHAAYNTPKIRAVYSFDTSPVTDSTSIDPRVKKQYRDGLTIFRIYESGEVLATLRWAIRQLLPLSTASPTITEVRFNFRSTFRIGGRGDGPVGEHSIKQLACDLICYLDAGGDETRCKVEVVKAK